MNRSALPAGSSSRFPGLVLALLLCGAVVLAHGHSATENDDESVVIPPDSDNVEVHEVKLVDGVFQEDHPVIMYKEDFVSEDYDASKNGTNLPYHPKRRRSHHRHAEQKAAKSTQSEDKKIYFDVLPERPIVLNSDLKAGPVDSQDAIQLVKPVKEEWLMKYPKKYHSRQRRQVYQPHNSPYVYPTYNHLPPIIYVARLPVSGKKPTWQGKNPQWQKQADRQPDDIFTRDSFLEHDSNPDNADFSIFDNPRPGSNNNAGGSGASAGGSGGRPTASVPASRPSNTQGQSTNSWGPNSSPPAAIPNTNVESSGFNPTDLVPSTRRPIVALPTERPNPWRTTPRPRPTTSRPRPPSGPKVTSCVWAIVNCCSSESKKIRYNCFEEFGCVGAFWDINPCADQGVLDADGVVADAYPIAASPSNSAPRPSAARPAFRQDTLQYPEEFDYQEGSKCHRASQLCCGLRNIASMFDCFQYQGCDQSISNIISGCS